MQMIDVMKRLAELDAQNPNIVKESQQVDECGIMPEMGMGAVERPHSPASINMTAASGPELSGMLRDIMQLAGLQHQAEPTSGALDVAPQVLEPATGDDAGPQSPADSMRSVLDKLNPSDDDAGKDDDSVTKAQGDLDDDGDHDMNDHELEKGDEKQDVDEYDNTPGNPNDKPAFDADEFAHQENQPGQGDRMDGDRPKAYADMNEAVTDLFAQYKKFVGEN